LFDLTRMTILPVQSPPNPRGWVVEVVFLASRVRTYSHRCCIFGGGWKKPTNQKIGPAE
jgi:hypothetical protein